MKKIPTLVATVIVTVLALLAYSQFTHAQSFHSGNNVTISSNKPINETVYAAGRTVDISSEIFGDVYCAGQNVTVSGTVHGDVLCAGQNVTVTGTIDGDTRLAGQTVNIGGNVKGSATVGGQSFVLQSRGSIDRDATIGSSEANLNGTVGRDLTTGGSNVTISNSVGRNISANAQHLMLTSSAKVGGNIRLVSNNDVKKDPGAMVNGSIVRTKPTSAQETSSRGGGIRWIAFVFFSMLITALVLLLIFPRFFQETTNQAFPLPWMALLTGFVASIIVPIIIIVLAATIIGIPLAIILALLWIVALLFSGPLFAYYIGRLILRPNRKQVLIMLLGAVILIILYLIPVVNIIAVLAAIWIGTGMLLLELFRRRTKLKPTHVTATTADST